MSGGRFQARYSHLGKQVAGDTTFATKADARACETDKRRGTLTARVDSEKLFGDDVEEWLDGRPIRPRTRDIYMSTPKCASMADRT
jgi:hypothetical protein